MRAEPLRDVASVLRRVEADYRTTLGDLDGVADITTSLLAVDTARKIVVLDRLVRRLGGALDPATRVLDVGVGRGRVLAMLGALGWRHLYGIDDFGDPTYGTVSARGDLERIGVEAVHADITDTPWDVNAGSVDLVVSFNTLEHLHASPRPVLAEIHRVLRPDGICVLGMPNLLALYKRLYVLVGRTNLPRFDVWWDDPGPWRGHVRETAPGELRAMLSRSGFTPTAEIGVDCEIPHRLGRLYPPYRALVALAPAQLADCLFCAGVRH